MVNVSRGQVHAVCFAGEASFWRRVDDDGNASDARFHCVMGQRLSPAAWCQRRQRRRDKMEDAIGAAVADRERGRGRQPVAATRQVSPNRWPELQYMMQLHERRAHVLRLHESPPTESERIEAVAVGPL
eukprot:ctg_1869.g404